MVNTEAVILAALLHDIGKVWQRTGKSGNHAEIGIQFIEENKNLFPDDWLDEIKDAVEKHHHNTINKSIEKIVQIANWLASGEKEDLGYQKSFVNNPLVPITSRVELLYPSPQESWGFNLKDEMELKRDVIFPHKEFAINYSNLWQKFIKEIELLKRLGYCFDGLHKITTLLLLARKYFSFVPAASGVQQEEETGGFLDISLYDHLKTTAAIAACLNKISPDDLESLHQDKQGSKELEVALMLRADMSGIQNFIYTEVQTGIWHHPLPVIGSLL